ncbi:MAG: Ig-like domain-containing protein [Abditibacteriota bacterium]|nr:Ig-like domain-containing protein [Abditibacteriota bacterium]
MKKTIFALISLLLFCGILWADDSDISPTNPKYLEWLEYGSEPVKTATGGLFFSGHVPPEFNSWTLPKDTGLKKGSLPASYDLRDEGRVPPVRNQNPYGICWAFAAMGGMEGNYLTRHPYGSIEYSTFNLVRWASDFYGTTLNTGGNYLKSTAYFAQLQGPVYEKEDPIDYSLDKNSVPPAPAKTPYIRGYITGAEYVPANVSYGSSEIWDGSSLNTAAMDHIKQLIMDEGAVEFAYYSNNDSYLTKTYAGGSAYYCNAEKSTNHEILIIGWDDNYSKYNFKTTAPGNGAWLARNSWGTDWGDDGYFWMSYYDNSAEQYAKFTLTEDTSVYNRYFYKEKKGLTSGLKKSNWGRVDFTPADAATLVDAATYVIAGGRNVTCYVYVNDVLKKTVTKYIEWPGYYLFRVNTSYGAGDKIRVIFQYDTEAEDGVWYIPLCNDASYCTWGSYVSSNGASWKDTLTAWDSKYAVCIKMYCLVPVPVTGISLNTSALTLGTGKGYSLTATVKPSGATNKKVTWSSSNTAVATVNSGTVTGKAPGTAVITARTADGGYTATCKVTVQQSVTGVSLNYGSIVPDVGETRTLIATVKPSDAANKQVTWSSSNTTIATVSSSGVVTAKKAGTCTITVKTVDGGFTDTCKVTVTDPVVKVTGVSLNYASLSLDVGDTRTLTATVSPSNATNKQVTWSSSNTAVATVSSSGLVTAKGAGSCTITVKTADSSYTDTCSVTVNQPVVQVTGVELSSDFVKLEKGDTATLKAAVLPLNATDKSVTWRTDDKTIATVSSSGVVTAVGPGTTKVRVRTRDGGYEAKCKIRVVISVTGVTLNKTTVKLRPGGTYTLKAAVTPADATNQEVTWMSYDTSVATVDQNGNVKAVGIGETRIRVKTRDGGFKAKCKIKVAVPVTGLSLDKTAVTVNAGSSVTLKATVSPSDATDKRVTWISYDPSIATVDSSGTVTGVKPGKVDVRAKSKDGDFTAKCKVTVK